jgi:hypothetical protein
MVLPKSTLPTSARKGNIRGSTKPIWHFRRALRATAILSSHAKTSVPARPTNAVHVTIQ